MSMLEVSRKLHDFFPVIIFLSLGILTLWLENHDIFFLNMYKNPKYSWKKNCLKASIFGFADPGISTYSIIIFLYRWGQTNNRDTRVCQRSLQRRRERWGHAIGRNDPCAHFEFRPHTGHLSYCVHSKADDLRLSDCIPSSQNFCQHLLKVRLQKGKIPKRQIQPRIVLYSQQNSNLSITRKILKTQCQNCL